MVNTYHWIARQGPRSVYMNGNNMTMDFFKKEDMQDNAAFVVPDNYGY